MLKIFEGGESFIVCSIVCSESDLESFFNKQKNRHQHRVDLRVKGELVAFRYSGSIDVKRDYLQCMNSPSKEVKPHFYFTKRTHKQEEEEDEE